MASKETLWPLRILNMTHAEPDSKPLPGTD